MTVRERNAIRVSTVSGQRMLEAWRHFVESDEGAVDLGLLAVDFHDVMGATGPEATSLAVRVIALFNTACVDPEIARSICLSSPWCETVIRSAGSVPLVTRTIRGRDVVLVDTSWLP
jgi:hypothetical protein